jgi:hypothetical protein
MSQKAYQLSHDLSKFEGEGVEPYGDGYLERYFKGWDKIDSAFYHAVPIILGGTKGEIIEGLNNDDMSLWFTAAKIPEDIGFIRTRECLGSTDYPYIWEPHGWPIMSRKMLDVLLSVGDFPHQVIPVIFKSEETKKLNDDYVILHLLELSDFLDLDRSVYTRRITVVAPKVEYIGDVKLKVLREPAGGFPPIFRIKGDSIPLHVSAVAKQALEDAGIQGLEFSTYQLETP